MVEMIPRIADHQLANFPNQSFRAEARKRHRLPTWTAGIVRLRAFVRSVLGCILRSLAASATSSNGSNPVSLVTGCNCSASPELRSCSLSIVGSFATWVANPVFRPLKTVYKCYAPSRGTVDSTSGDPVMALFRSKSSWAFITVCRA